MTISLEYIGAAERYFETASTGKSQSWRRGQTQDVSDTDAALLMATGLFAYGGADAQAASNIAPGKPVTATTNLTGRTGFSAGDDSFSVGGTFPLRDNKALGYIVDSFASLTGFSAASGNGSGSHAVLSGGGPNGEDVVRMTLASAGPYRLNKNIVLPVAKFTTRGGYFVQAIRVNDVSLVSKLQQFFFLTGGSQYYQRFPTVYLATDKNDVQTNEWFYVTWSGGEMSAGGGAAAFDSNALDTASIRFGIDSTLSVSGGTVDFGPLWYSVRQKPVVTFSFDDSNKTDITLGKPILDRYGFRATTHTIREQIGQTNYLTNDDLLKLYGAGWEIGVHGSYSHADTLLTEEAIMADLQFNLGIYSILGIPRSYCYAYPEGDYLPASIRALRALKFKCAGNVHATPKPIKYVNKLTYSRSGTSGKTLTALKLEVDAVIARGSQLDFFTHGLYNVGGIHTDPAIFEPFVEYVAEKVEAGLVEAGFTAGEYFI